MYPNSWMVFVRESPTNMDDDWGYSHFGKPPCGKNTREQGQNMGNYGKSYGEQWQKHILEERYGKL